ncbi:glycosyltransferase family 61 protein [Bordetella bronchialis]
MRRYRTAWEQGWRATRVADFDVLFNAKWYATTGVGRLGRYFPWLHYLFVGAFRGRKPCPLFDGNWYLARYPDVNAAGINPLVHYLTRGAGEGRDPNPYFDSAWYLARYPDVAAGGMNPLVHYLRYGAGEGRDPNPVFSTEWYVTQHEDTCREQTNPLEYFVEFGQPRGDLPGPLFDPAWYAFENPDVVAAGQDPLVHYLQYGRHEGRRPAAGPNHFASIATLNGRLSGLPLSLEAAPASAILRIASVEKALSDAGAGVRGRLIYRAAGTAEGVLESQPYPREVSVAELRDVHVLAGTRYVLGGAQTLIHDEEDFFFDEPGAWVKYGRARRTESSKFYIGFGLRQLARLTSGISLMHEYSSNYFHLLTEVLPRLLLVEQTDIPAHVPLLIDEGLHDNLRRLLLYANGGRRRIVELERYTLYRTETLYQPSDVSVVVDAYEGGVAARQTALDVERIRAVVNRCRHAIGGLVGPSRGRKVYAARRGAIRNLLNQDELEAGLMDLGFEVVHPEKLSIEEQIGVFEQADVVVGPTGAQMTNIAWCRPGTRVIVLASDHHSHQLYMWQLLGRASGAEVAIMQGPRAYRRDDIFSVHDDYHVELRDVVNAVRSSERHTN